MGLWSRLGNIIEGAADVVGGVAGTVLGAAVSSTPLGAVGGTVLKVGAGFMPANQPINVRGGGYDEPGFDLNPFDAFNEVPTPGTAPRGSMYAVPATTVTPAARECLRCPKGYVLIRDPRNPSAATCMLKTVARQMGLWKPRPKPPMSASDYRKLRIAKRVEKKIKRMAGMAGYTCREKGKGVPRKK